MKPLLTTLCIALLLGCDSPGVAQEQDPLIGFVAGRYHLVGKALDSSSTYYGSLMLTPSAEGLRLRRVINGVVTNGLAAIEYALADRIPILRMRFSAQGMEFEENCLIDSDLDNFARISCHLYQQGITSDDPGLEVLFIDHAR